MADAATLPSASQPAAAAPAAAAPLLGKSGKKICCACPGACPSKSPRARQHRTGTRPLTFFTSPPTRADTKRVRDACVVGKGEEKCGTEIEAHKVCLRADGFTVA